MRSKGNNNGWKTAFWVTISIMGILFAYLVLPSGARIERMNDRLNVVERNDAVQDQVLVEINRRLESIEGKLDQALEKGGN